MKDTGGPAFPAHDYIVGDIAKDKFAKLGETRGMTLRDYFAAKAMQAIIELPEDELTTCAQYAYAVADAMIEARNQP